MVSINPGDLTHQTPSLYQPLPCTFFVVKKINSYYYHNTTPCSMKQLMPSSKPYKCQVHYVRENGRRQFFTVSEISIKKESY